MALEGTVKTPFGNVSKKTAVIVGGGGVLLLGIVWYRSKKAGGSSTSSSATDTTSATDQSNIDPATGFPYGSPEDVAALQQQQMIGGGFGPVFGGGGTPGGTTGPGPGSFTSNGQWAQYAEDYLVNTVGEPAADVGNALGKYLTAQPVDTTGKGYINQAIAFAGFPPVAGPNGNPPGIVDGPGGPPPPGNVTVPNVIGMETDAGQRAIVAAGLVVSRSQKLKPGVGSTIVTQSPSAGAQVAKGSTVTITIKEKR